MTHPDMKNVQSRLRNDNFIHLDSMLPPRYFTEDDRRMFQSYWGNLVLDENFKSYTTRERRILRYKYRHPGDLRINRNPEYRPRAEYKIDYVKGVNKLTYAEEGFIQHTIMRDILRRNLEAIDFYFRHDLTYEININMFRVRADGGKVSPTTSGIHQDGSDWIFMHFVHAHNIKPVHSVVYHSDDAGAVVFRKPMTAFLETLVINDQTMFHSAEDVIQDNPDMPAHRDLIVMGVNKASEAG